jgi:hypothetical protein
MEPDKPLLIHDVALSELDSERSGSVRMQIIPPSPLRFARAKQR